MSQDNYLPLAKTAINLIDLTLLDEAASNEILSSLADKANHYQVAAVCVLPQHTGKIRLNPHIKLATVLNFPAGKQSDLQVLTAIDTVLAESQIDEIDYVFPYQDYLAGKQSYALAQCKQVLECCLQQRITFKVIMETGALPSTELIYQLSRELIDCGCHFLKTSTGKIAQGATPSAVLAMLRALKDAGANCGLKVSGGVKEPEQAFHYIAMAEQTLEREIDKSWFRIGASSLLEELLKFALK